MRKFKVTIPRAPHSLLHIARIQVEQFHADDLREPVQHRCWAASGAVSVPESISGQSRDGFGRADRAEPGRRAGVGGRARQASGRYGEVARKLLACVGIAALLALPVESSAQAISGVGLPLSQPMTIVTATGVSSIPVPAWANYVQATYCGAGSGGGGGFSAITGGGGGGGAAGQIVLNYLAGVTPGSSLTVTNGAHGAGGSAGNPGSAGQVTTISGGLMPFPAAYPAGGGGAGLSGAGGAGGTSGQSTNSAFLVINGAAAAAAGPQITGGLPSISAQSGGAGGGGTTIAGGTARAFGAAGVQIGGGTSGVGQGGGGGAGGPSLFGDGGAGGNGSSGVASPTSAPAANTCAGGGGGGAGSTGAAGSPGSDGAAYLRFVP